MRRARFGVGARGSRNAACPFRGGGSRIPKFPSLQLSSFLRPERTIELDVEASDTIDTVKAKIQASFGSSHFAPAVASNAGLDHGAGRATTSGVTGGAVKFDAAGSSNQSNT